jgi:hemerythrin-like domain-containing protein
LSTISATGGVNGIISIEIYRENENLVTKISDNAKNAHKPELDDLDKIIDFLRLFADKFHHGKEETIYFPALVEEGMSNENSPVAVMRFEHEVGRGYIKDIASAIELMKHDRRLAMIQ